MNVGEAYNTIEDGIEQLLETMRQDYKNGAYDSKEQYEEMRDELVTSLHVILKAMTK